MSTTNWRCTICGVVVASETAPPHCPECGARDAMFEPSSEPAHGVEHNPLQPHDAREQGGVTLGPGHGCLGED
jgi:hypothetical protein